MRDASVGNRESGRDSSPRSRTVRVRATDGFSIAATEYDPPRGARAVVVNNAATGVRRRHGARCCRSPGALVEAIGGDAAQRFARYSGPILALSFDDDKAFGPRRAEEGL